MRMFAKSFNIFKKLLPIYVFSVRKKIHMISPQINEKYLKILTYKIKHTQSCRNGWLLG